MDTTANLNLPYIMPSQAQKHVTHNEAIRLLDALVQLSVASRSTAAPPGAPANGLRHIVPAGASGAWAGWAGDVALFVDGGWMRLRARAGWRAWVEDEAVLCVFDGADWQPVSISSGPDGSFDTLGVNASADGTTRLAVSANATLLNHAGTSHRLTLNKAASGDTASLLLQTGFSGRAEIGTTGDSNLHVKVSSDGSTWREALRVGSADARVGVGQTTLNCSALNIKGRALTGSADGWFGITVTQTDADTTSKGGAVLTGAPYANANKPFMALGPWSTATANTIYYGGGGWGVPDATNHLFYAGAYAPGTDNGSTLALSITDAAVLSHRPNAPATNNTHSLGTSSLRWSVVYAATGTINTSDERLKTDIAPVPLGLAFVRDLQPVAYRWTSGGNAVVRERVADPDPKGETADEISVDRAVPRPGGRTHYGLLAQQVRQTLDAHGVGDFAGWTLADKDDPDSEQGLRYDQFIPILIRAVQDLAERLDAVEAVESN